MFNRTKIGLCTENAGYFGTTFKLFLVGILEYDARVCLAWKNLGKLVRSLLEGKFQVGVCSNSVGSGYMSRLDIHLFKKLRIRHNINF